MYYTQIPAGNVKNVKTDVSYLFSIERIFYIKKMCYLIIII